MRNQMVIWTLACLLLAGTAALAAEDFEAKIVKAKQLVEEGASRQDAKMLERAREQFRQLLERKQMAWLVDYYLGYTDYRLAIYHRIQKDREQEIKFLDEAIDHLNASLDENEKFAEASALLSAVLGLRISTDPSLGNQLGIEASAALQDARAYAPDNPRVAFVSALSAYYTPEQYGGSKQRGLEEMQRAVRLFQSQKVADRTLPDWGQTDALAFLAQMQMDSGKAKQARQSLEQALRLRPDFGFAKKLLEQLEQQNPGN